MHPVLTVPPLPLSTASRQDDLSLASKALRPPARHPDTPRLRPSCLARLPRPVLPGAGEACAGPTRSGSTAFTCREGAGWKRTEQTCRPLAMLQHGTRSSFQSVSPDVSSHLTQPFGPCASTAPCRWPARPDGHAISSRILRLVADAAPDLLSPVFGSASLLHREPAPTHQASAVFVFHLSRLQPPPRGQPSLTPFSTWRLRFPRRRLVPFLSHHTCMSLCVHNRTGSWRGCHVLCSTRLGSHVAAHPHTATVDHCLVFSR